MGSIDFEVLATPAGRLPAMCPWTHAQDGLFRLLCHSAAVVGLNTSAMIEAAIVGRPVLTVLLPEFRDNQEGTVHFHYLLDGPEALLRASRSMRSMRASCAARGPRPDRIAARGSSAVSFGRGASTRDHAIHRRARSACLAPGAASPTCARVDLFGRC